MMYFFSENQLNKYLKDKEYLGFGLEGNCYRIPENKVLKIYDAKLEKECTDTFCKSYFLKFKDLKINNFYFIRDVLNVFCYLKGTICDYADGRALNSIKLINTPIVEVVNALRELNLSIQKLSQEGICANDIFEGNILYHNGHFSIIDTAHFYIEHDKSINVYEENMFGLMQIIMECLFDKVLFKNNLIFDYLNSINFSINDDFYLYPADMVLIIKVLLENECEMTINSFSDAIPILERKLG